MSLPQLSDCLGHRILRSQGLKVSSDVPKDVMFFSYCCDTFKGSNGEQVRLKEGHVLVISCTRAVVWPPRECICLAHASAWSMVEREVERRQVEGPSCLPSVELLRGPKIL